MDRRKVQYTQEQFLKKSVDAAQFYGFGPVSLFTERGKERAARKRSVKTPQLKEKITSCDSLILDMVQTYATQHISLVGHPVLTYMSSLESPYKKRRSRRPIAFGLFAIGAERSLAEALVVHTARSILADMGCKDTCVALNSVGDRDSAATASRELTNYFRKNLQALPATCRQAFKKDAFSALACVREKAPALLENVPKPMQYLSDGSRNHLKDVLEYFEESGAQYEIDEALVGPRECYTGTLFEVREHFDEIGGPDAAPVLAHGGRFDGLPQRMYKIDTSMVGLIVEAPTQRGTAPQKLPNPKRATPHVFFVQVGPSAKHKSLAVMEQLRKARITIRHALLEDRLSDQLEMADRSGAPYVVIIGQKEALEGVALVRSQSDHAQESVSIAELPQYLKDRLQ